MSRRAVPRTAAYTASKPAPMRTSRRYWPKVPPGPGHVSISSPLKFENEVTATK